jgi:hypothetical protein
MAQSQHLPENNGQEAGAPSGRVLFLRMPRPCTTCLDPRLPEISVDMAKGVSDVAIAKKYGLARSSVQRHHMHLVGNRMATARQTKEPPRSLNSMEAAKRTGKAFMALACLPSADEVNQAYASITSRIDAIAAKAEQEGSLAVALMGLKELRSTVTAQAQLAGHVGSGAQVQVNTQVNVDVGAAVKEIIAALRPPPDAAIPPELAVHLGDADVTADALARLEAVIDGE